MSFKTEKGIIYSIAPWSLPKEEIPVNLKFPKNMVFDKVTITIPEELNFVNFFNVEKLSTTKNFACIKKIITTKSTISPCYFGFTVALNEIPKKLKSSKKIVIKIWHNNRILEFLNINAKIFRPKLEVTDIIEKVELTDDNEKYKVPMNLKYVGFGDIQLKIEGEIEGKLVSQGESIIYEILRRIWLLDSQGELTTKNKAQNNNFHVKQKVIHELTDDIEKKINEGDISGISDIIDEPDIESFTKWFENPQTKEKFLNVIYTRVEDIFLDLLTEVVGKNPTDNVRLANSQTNIRAKLNSHIEYINTRLRYKDSIGNEYDPVEIPVKIVDSRKERTKTTINMPIVIEKWEEEPFMNVEDMKVEEE